MANPEAVTKETETTMTSTIGQDIDALYELKQKKKQLEAKAELIQEEISQIEAALIARMDREQTTKGAGRQASVSLGELERYSIIEAEQDDFYAFIHRHKYYHLLERRPATLACREFFERGKRIPGISRFVKRTVKVTPIIKEK